MSADHPLRFWSPAAPLIAALAMPVGGWAQNVEAGKARAAAVCAACHGFNGVSVSGTIPNLRGQRAAYLQAQLRFFKDGTRREPGATSRAAIMNAVAAQLSPSDMADVAAYYSGLPDESAVAKSDMLPNLAKTAVTFPDDYRTAFTKYATIDFPERKEVRRYYANDVALRAARRGEPLPDGSVLFAEVYAAAPAAGGILAPDRITGYTAMARNSGWGRDFPDALRNGDWNYAIFTPAGQYRAGVNQAECLACHKPQERMSYTFTLERLVAAAHKK